MPFIRLSAVNSETTEAAIETVKSITISRTILREIAYHKLLNGRRRIRNFRDKPKRFVTATTTLSATRALHINTPRDRQRALQEMMMSN